MHVLDPLPPPLCSCDLNDPPVRAPVPANPMRPDAAILCKLGSIVRHCEEGLSAQGHHFDLAAVEALLADPQVREWMARMDTLALLPVRR